MEKSGPDVQNEKLLALLKELASLQIKEMQVGAASFVKKTGRTISESVEELKKYLEEQSKIYKQSRTDIDEVVERYKGDLADARKLYKDEKSHLIEEKSEWEDSLTESRAEYAEKKQEFLGMAGYKQFIEKRQEIARLEQQGRKKEAAKKREEFAEYKASLAKQEKALKIGMSLSIEQGNTIRIKEMAENLEAIQEQMVLAERDTELATIRSKMGMHKREIANLEKQIENCETNFKTEVENLTDARGKAIAKVDKQNMLQKLMVKMFGSAKKFDQNVMKPLKQNIETFSTVTLPARKIEMQDRRAKRKREFIEKAGQVKETAIEKAGRAKETVVEKVGQVKEVAVEKAGQVKETAIEKAGKAKETVVEKAGQVKEVAEDTFLKVIAKAKDTKNNIITGIKARMMSSIQKKRNREKKLEMQDPAKKYEKGMFTRPNKEHDENHSGEVQIEDVDAEHGDR